MKKLAFLSFLLIVLSGCGTPSGAGRAMPEQLESRASAEE